MLELELEQWREALEKRGMKVSGAKTEYMCLNGTPLGSVKMQSAQLPQVTEFKYLGSTLQSDGDMNAEVNKRTQCGWNNWRKMSGVLCDTRVPPHVKRKIHKMIVKVETITERCRKGRLRWFGHVKRRDQEYVGRKTLEMVPPGRRKRGRPKQRWMDCVNRDMRAIGTTTGWRRIVSAAATPQPSWSG